MVAMTEEELEQELVEAVAVRVAVDQKIVDAQTHGAPEREVDELHEERRAALALEHEIKRKLREM
jgi:hypothetical protein